MRVLIVVSDRLKLGALSRHPDAVLGLDASLLQSSHPLDRHRYAQAQEVIEGQVRGVFDVRKQTLDTPKLRVHDTEQLLDSIVRRAIRSDHSVEALVHTNVFSAEGVH
jgi:hypothetical protein